MIRLTDEQWERIRNHFPEENIADGRPGRKPDLKGGPDLVAGSSGGARAVGNPEASDIFVNKTSDVFVNKRWRRWVRMPVLGLAKGDNS